MHRLTAAALSLAAPVAAVACSLCPVSGNVQPFRQEAAQAKIVLYGTLQNPRLNAAGVGGIGGGTTDLAVETVIKSHPFVAGKPTVQVEKYIPVNPQQPTKFLLFADVYNNKLDAYRGLPLKSPTAVMYIADGLKLDGQGATATLLHAFNYLNSDDADVSSDAFLEFARASNVEVAAVAPKLDAAKLRSLIGDKAHPERVALYCYLLGASGRKDDVPTLLHVLHLPHEEGRLAITGALAGLVLLDPPQGWRVLDEIARDPKRHFADRMAALKTLEFVHSTQGAAARDRIVATISPVVEQVDLADVAIEYLRRWNEWGPANTVFAQFGKPTHASPLTRRGIVRYALQCPNAEAKAFLTAARASDAAMVKDVEEAMEFEKPLTPFK